MRLKDRTIHSHHWISGRQRRVSAILKYEAIHRPTPDAYATHSSTMTMSQSCDVQTAGQAHKAERREMRGEMAIGRASISYMSQDKHATRCSSH